MFTAYAPRPSFARPGFAAAPPGSSAGGGGSAPADTFNALVGDSGISKLPHTLLLDGVTYQPAFVFDGTDAGAATWTSDGVDATQLSVIGSGTDPTLSQYTPGTDAERAVAFNAGKSYQATSSTTAGDVGTDDFVIEAVFQVGAASFSMVASKINSAANQGWFLIANSGAGKVRFTVANSGGSSPVEIPATLTQGLWVHVIVFVDRDGNARLYSSGAMEQSNSVAARAATLDTADKLEIGAYAGSTLGKLTGNIATVRMWRLGAGVIGSTASQDACAADRSARYENSRAATALGSAVATTNTRTTAAYLDRVVDDGTGERRLFFMAPNHMRYCRRKELAGGEFLAGALQENQATNLCLRSEAFDDAAWTKTAATISANGRAAVTGEASADGIVGNALLAIHGVSQAITLTAAGYVASFFVEAGNQSFCFIENATIANGRVWFNLATGAVGTTQAGITEARIEPYGLGRFRVSARFTGTAAAHTIGVFAASADNVTGYTGDSATVNLWVWGAQVELAPQDTNPSTYIPTTSATVTRTADQLVYKMDDGNYTVGPGRLEVDVLYTFAKSPTNVHVIATASGSPSSTTDSVFIRTNNTTGTALVVENVAGAAEYSISGTTSNVDGEKHTITNSWATNAGRLLVDGVQQGATDTSVNPLAAAPATLTIGNLSASAFHNALIGNLKLRNAA